MESIKNLMATKKTLIILGAGGVGKTTSAILLGFVGALQGRRVAVLSIDPAKRLAAALGIQLGNQMSEVVFSPEHGVKGTLHAAMLDQKAVFDAMVMDNSLNEKVAAKILANPTYRAASTNLSGPLEYMALAKLAELSSDPRFDLVIVDTPPDTHAMDFLNKPNILSGFMDKKVMNWLIKPYSIASKFGLNRVLSASEKLMGGISQVTGVKALGKFADFYVLMQDVIEGFHKSSEKVVELLRTNSAAFALITVPTQIQARTAELIASELQKLNYSISALIFNKCLPPEIASAVLDVEGGPYEIYRRRSVGEAKVRSALVQTLSAQVEFSGQEIVIAEQEYNLTSIDAMVRLAHSLND